MSNYYPIESVIERLRDEYDWTHSFIRECYLSTARNLKQIVDAGEIIIGDTQAPQNGRLIVSSAGNATNLGIEFVLHDIIKFSIQSIDELRFNYECDGHSCHLIRFAGLSDNDVPSCFFLAKKVDVLFLGKTYQGIALRIGYEYPFEDTVDAINLEGCWRLCSACSNAWEENPSIIFSRCPHCGFLTKLQCTEKIQTGIKRGAGLID